MSLASEFLVPHDSGGYWTYRDRLVSPDTTVLLRSVLGELVILLDPYADGDWTVDGSGISVNGKFRPRVDIKKVRNPKMDANGPILVETTPHAVAEYLKSDTWRPLKQPDDWRRVVAIMALPFGYVGDVRVYENTVGERAALQPMLDCLVGLDVRRDGKLLCDGGFNGAEYRDMTHEAGLVPWIPWPKNQKSGLPVKVNRALIRHAAQIEAQFDLHWRDPEKRALFIAAYNIRSKHETLWSVWNNDYPRIRVRSGAGPENEVLLMAICHNIKRMLQLLSLAGKERSFALRR